MRCLKRKAEQMDRANPASNVALTVQSSACWYPGTSLQWAGPAHNESNEKVLLIS